MKKYIPRPVDTTEERFKDCINECVWWSGMDCLADPEASEDEMRCKQGKTRSYPERDNLL